MEQCWVYTPLNNTHPKRGRHEIRDEETQLEEEPVRAHERVPPARSRKR